LLDFWTSLSGALKGLYVAHQAHQESNASVPHPQMCVADIKCRLLFVSLPDIPSGLYNVLLLVLTRLFYYIQCAPRRQTDQLATLKRRRRPTACFYNQALGFWV
jgi:hypothetical protein